MAEEGELGQPSELQARFSLESVYWAKAVGPDFQVKLTVMEWSEQAACRLRSVACPFCCRLARGTVVREAERCSSGEMNRCPMYWVLS